TVAPRTKSQDNNPRHHPANLPLFRRSSMARTPSTMLPLGTPAPDFSLPNIDGRTLTLADFADAQGLVVAFICNHCPFVKHLADDLASFGREMQDRGIAMVAISSNDAENYPDDS